MKISNLPVITKHQFTGLTQQHEKHMERMSEIGSLSEKNKDTSPLKKTLYSGGRNVYREDFKTWSLFQPLCLGELLKAHTATTKNYAVQLKKIRHAASKGRLRTAVERKTLHRLWLAKWSLGHLTLLIYSDISFAHKTTTKEISEQFAIIPLLMSNKLVPMNLMALWTAAKMGKHLFWIYKKQFIEERSPWSYLTATLLITAIALRHSSYKTEVLKLLQRKIKKLHVDVEHFVETVKFSCAACLSLPELGSEMLEQFAEAYFDKEYKEYFGREITNELPFEMKLLFIMRNERRMLHTPDWSPGVALFLPWMISRDPHEFYIPKKYQELFYPYKPEQAMELATENLMGPTSSGVLKTDKKPGRNQPCHCGSNKKYKKCCFKKGNAVHSNK